MAVRYEMVGGTMEILTLLKANILRKKGTFISIMLLTAIVTIVITTIFSVKDNYNEAVQNSIEYSDCGDFLTIVRAESLTDELCKKIEEHELVERVDYYPAICSNDIQCGEIYNSNSCFLMEMRDGIRLINENEDGYAKEIPKLKSGEIYLPLGLKQKISCNVGDTVTIGFIGGIAEDFKVMGFVEEIAMGSMSIGWKQVFICREDYEKILKECMPYKGEDITLETVVVLLHKIKTSDLSAARFQRRLNLDTGIVQAGVGAMNIEQSANYTKLLTDIVMDIVMAFAIFLFIIVLIVMSHSIGTELEIEYTTLGVLKSQGFTDRKIRFLFIFQYMAAQVMGILAGNIAAVPIERKIGSVCQEITGVISEKGLAVWKCLAFALAILVISAGLIYIKTIKISKISPVRAISGGREEIFFDSRLTLPIVKKPLSASLSLRQFTTAKKRYMGTIFIVAILTFCMITVNLTGNLLTSQNALSEMGVIIPDITVYFADDESNVKLEEIDSLVEDITPIKEKNSTAYTYASLNGENLFLEILEYPEYAHGIIKGRAPLYENEIMITEVVADLLDIKTGDEVSVSFKNKENIFIISGVYQSAHDTGMSFFMNYKGVRRYEKNIESHMRYYVVEDKSKTDVIVEKIFAEYGDMLTIETFDSNNTELEQYGEIVSMLKLIIYTFSILFAFVVIRMVCTKSFVQERSVIGIYKSLGFTSNMLRLQFAVRFLIMALIGEAAGAVLSIFFSGKALEMFLSMTGTTRVAVEYTAMAFIVPIAALSISFFVFSFIASRKIRRVEVRELITE